MSPRAFPHSTIILILVLNACCVEEALEGGCAVGTAGGAAGLGTGVVVACGGMGEGWSSCGCD
jgi:hypothetical protein